MKMARQWIGPERLSLGGQHKERNSSLDAMSVLIDLAEIDQCLCGIHAAAKGEPEWSQLLLFKALLPAAWHDLSDVKLAEALEDRASFRRFCGFSASEPRILLL
jgi:IS5 family transposase